MWQWLKELFVDPLPERPDPLIEKICAAWYWHPIEYWNAPFLAATAIDVIYREMNINKVNTGPQLKAVG